MKLSHYQTPRTLADCTFTVGYYSPEIRQSIKLSFPIKATLKAIGAIGILALIYLATR